MASIFTYDPDPPRVSSPWSMPGTGTPQPSVNGNRGSVIRTRSGTNLDRADPDSLSDYGITKLEPEPQEGPTEYKLHLLLRPRRVYTAMSTGHLVSGSQHSRSALSTSGPTASSHETSPRAPQARSLQSRQQRLQQLTTQLLWRLQQSSPFHSSTAANLILPVLPEATSQLSVPPKPLRLLPGLEESQGALYEIGVADDGVFVGLCLDELEESLATLQVMAASLGCRVEVLRRVVVGRCEWVEDPHDGNAETAQAHSEHLWVAEALVSPDLDFYRTAPLNGHKQNGKNSIADIEETTPENYHSSTEQIRVSITGPSTAGKSSLLGALTSSSLDNGRGKSRLSLLKHRHEISSGITSSVAQELLGYNADDPASKTADVINYASGNVAGWDDIHVASTCGRLAFVSDLPGSVRYSKSMLRGLISWAPHYAVLCVPANCGNGSVLGTDSESADQAVDISLSLSYLELCIKLEVPILVAITKLDSASRAGLRNKLTKVLSALKTAGKKPTMLAVSSETPDKAADLQRISLTDGEEAKRIIDGIDDWSSTVPIILTSAVDGSGIGKLHAFLRYLPIPKRPTLRTTRIPNSTSSQHLPANVFDIDEVFAIPPSKVYSLSAEQTPKEIQGVVLCGLVRYGSISIGDELVIGPLLAYPQTEQGGPNVDQRRPSDYHGDSPPGELLTSFAQGFLSGKAPFPGQAQWQRVRVVSVRNIRLSVQKLMEDQVGTVGIEPVSSQEGERLPLGRVRKGTVLASFDAPCASIPKSLLFHTGFVATFPSSEFSSVMSPPVLLGGHAIVYISNIRTTVKVTCVTLADDEVISSPPSPTEPDFFKFDEVQSDREKDNHGVPREAELNQVVNSLDHTEQGDIRIAFSFVTSIEWVEVGSQVFLMPGAPMASSSATPGSASLFGLEGFVGRVCEVLHDGETSDK